MELDGEHEAEPTGLRDDDPPPVSDSEEDESDGEGPAEFKQALRHAEPRKYRIVDPVNPVPANDDEIDNVDDFKRVEAGDAILSTFPGARATREDGGHTKVLVGPDELHRKFVLFLGEYARIPDPDYVVTAEDRDLFSLYMKLAHRITPCSRHSHARKRTKGMGDHIGKGGWCCMGHNRAAQYKTLVEILGAAAADQLRAATPSEPDRVAIISRAEATLMACQPKRLASFVVAGHSAFVGPVLLANTGLALKRVVSGDDDREPLTLGIVPEKWVESGLPALPPPPPGFAYAHADEAHPYVAPAFLTCPPRDPYLPYDRAAVGLAAAPTAPSPTPSPMTTTAVVCWDPLGPAQGPYHSPFWDDSCENTGLSVATGASCIAPARAVSCKARLVINGVVSFYAPVVSGVPGGVLRRVIDEGRLVHLDSVDGGFDCDFVLYLGAHTRSLLVAGISSRLPPGGDVALKFRAKSVTSAQRALFGDEVGPRLQLIAAAMRAPHYERKRRDFHQSDLTVLYFRRRDAGLLAATRRRLGSAVDAMLQRPSHAAAAELRDSINASAPFASELRVERRAARHLERSVTATMLSAKLRSMSVSG